MTQRTLRMLAMSLLVFGAVATWHLAPLRLYAPLWQPRGAQAVGGNLASLDLESGVWALELAAQTSQPVVLSAVAVRQADGAVLAEQAWQLPATAPIVMKFAVPPHADGDPTAVRLSLLATGADVERAPPDVRDLQVTAQSTGVRVRALATAAVVVVILALAAAFLQWRKPSRKQRWLAGGAAVLIAVAFAAGPSGVLHEKYTDHKSHVQETILATRAGWSTYYAHPPKRVCHDVPAACADPRDPSKVLAQINWPQLVKPYPPGMFAWHALPALLYLVPQVPVGWVWLLASLLDVAAALVAGWLLAQQLAVRSEVAGLPFLATWVILPLFLLRAVLAGADGFHDTAFLAAIAASAWSVQRQAWPRALGWFALAAVLHFRALYFLPLAVWSAWSWWQARGSDEMALHRPRHIALLAFVVLAAALVCWSSLLVAPGLNDFPVSNPWQVDALRAMGWAGLGRACWVLMPALWLWRLRARWSATTLLLACLGLFLARQAQVWHALVIWGVASVVIAEGVEVLLSLGLVLMSGVVVGGLQTNTAESFLSLELPSALISAIARAL